MTKRTKLISSVVLIALAVCAIFLGVSWMSGCTAKPSPVQPPVPSTPQPTDPTPPPPDVDECVAKVRSMQSAVAIAKIGAALIVSKESKYGPAIKVALVAVAAALAEAEKSCDTGNVDGWAIAIAAFDAAFVQLVDAGEGISASRQPTDIAPPPPYAISLEQFTAMAFEAEMSYADEDVR